MAGRHQRRVLATAAAQAPATIPFPSEVFIEAAEDEPHSAQHLRAALRLLAVGTSLQGQSCRTGADICREVSEIMQGRARLVLRWLRSPGNQPDLALAPLFSYPVRYQERGYGTLYVAPDAADPDTPAIPLTFAHLYAEICGLLLFSFEQSALLCTLGQHLEPQPIEVLTRREHEILTLICKGRIRCEIAETLSIARGTLAKHYQHIYAKLDVHDERDALLIAFREGLVSFLE